MIRSYHLAIVHVHYVYRCENNWYIGVDELSIAYVKKRMNVLCDLNREVKFITSGYSRNSQTSSGFDFKAGDQSTKKCAL